MSRIDLAEVRASLQNAGHRVTQQRLAIARAVQEAADPLTPEEILQKAAARQPGIGLVTVYRTVTLLTELGHVRRIHEPNGCYRYISSSMEHSHHVVCRKCRGAVEFAGTERLAPLIDRVADLTGFEIEDHLLELVGVCPDCQAGIS